MKLKWIIITVILFHTSLSTWEAVRAIECHRTGSECWPWAFTIVVNIPATAVIEGTFKAIIDQFGIVGFSARTAVHFIMYVVGGSLWWLLIVLSIRSFVRFIVRVFNKKPAES